MDKEIIIDGVDVSGCERLENTYCNLGIICKGKDCYYKQLQRAKAENFELKESLKISQGLCKTLEIAKANEHNHWFNRCCEINTECDKYRQALQEIKTIAEEWMTDYCYLDSFYEKEGCCICHENKDCYSYRLLKTLTKAEEE